MPMSEFMRTLTTSFLTIVLTRKCFPMSRRKSMADNDFVQSRLLTMRAAYGPSKSRMGAICFLIRSTHDATTSGAFSVRSVPGLGSPISPVAPPTNASGKFPAL